MPNRLLARGRDDGGGLINGCNALREVGAVRDTVVCAIDREQGGKQDLEAEGVALLAALSRGDLVPGDGGVQAAFRTDR